MVGLVRKAPEADASAGDLERLLRTRDVRARARADGAADHPPSAATQESELERDVARALAHDQARIAAQRAEARDAFEQRMRLSKPQPLDIAGVVLEARLAMRQAEGRIAHDYAIAAARAEANTRDLDSFARTHQLRRAAMYPESRVLQAGLLLVAALFEALFSAALFAEDDARGLLGGAVTAIGLSGANVILGFLAGFLGLRYVQHARLPQRIVGGAGFALFAATALFLNFFAAIWRQDVAAAAEAGSDASGFFARMFSLSEPQAIVLLMLGGGVWVFAALKGFSGFDDPYPDYGKLARAKADAEEALSDLRGEARLALEAPIETARAAIAARLDEARARAETLERLYDEAVAALAGLDAEARRLDAAAIEAVHTYRQENLSARKTPAPAYFAAEPRHEGAALDPLRAAGEIVAAGRAALAAAQTEAHQGVEALMIELESVQARLDGVS